MICPNCQQEAEVINHNNRGWRTQCCWSSVPAPEVEEMIPETAVEPEEKPALDLDALEAQELQEYLEQVAAKEVAALPEVEVAIIHPDGTKTVVEPQVETIVINTGDGVDDKEASAAGQALAARRKKSSSKKPKKEAAE